MKKYGIYLAYPPTVRLAAEGLGRHLIEFIKGAQQKGDVCFVIACPSWMRNNLLTIFQSAHISSHSYELIGPIKKPVILRLYERYHAIYTGYRKKPFSFNSFLIKRQCQRFIRIMKKKLLFVRNPFLFLAIGIILTPIVLALSITVGGLLMLRHLTQGLFHSIGLHTKKTPYINRVVSRLKQIVLQPKTDNAILNLHRIMCANETALMVKKINRRKEILAWYCPTAFWPSFNQIQAAKLICVPDVVLTQFPVVFSTIGGERFLETFQQVEETINGGEHFVTYSDDTKWRTLVQKYHCTPSAIHVVPHGANRLDTTIFTSTAQHDESSINAWCQKTLNTALQKNIYPTVIYQNSADLNFLFYASQCRPNKNMLSLLRAYRYLLKERFLGIKLVLTGNPQNIVEIDRFITDHHLKNDVLCLHGLSDEELAACYKLAALAINPSFSEGGCPFTFTEALSVNTPVIMADIPVTKEVIEHPDLNDIMFFDPYDWRDMAHRIEWALANRTTLLEKQIPFYNALKERTWTHVVDDYIRILDRISNQNTHSTIQQPLPKTAQDKRYDEITVSS